MLSLEGRAEVTVYAQRVYAGLHFSKCLGESVPSLEKGHRPARAGI